MRGRCDVLRRPLAPGQRPPRLASGVQRHRYQPQRLSPEDDGGPAVTHPGPVADTPLVCEKGQNGDGNKGRISQLPPQRQQEAKRVRRTPVQRKRKKKGSS